MRTVLHRLLATSIAAMASVVLPKAAHTQIEVDPSDFSELGYRYLGPPGNRVSSVAGVPGDPLTYYAGAASGGIWKTSDGGIHWDPIFDDQPVASIGALAIAPSNPNIIWAGTGETFLRSHISMGWGAFKSTDAGETWQRAGLEEAGRIGRIVIHPNHPDIVHVAALGHAFGPQPERGIFRTTDGGRTWDHVLFVNDSTGAIDIVMHPENPDILYAATWQIEMRTWGRTSGGAGSGIWTSHDGGLTWTRLEGNGLPHSPLGKIGLAVSAANPNRVYALIETGSGIPWQGQPTDSGALWRSDDNASTWDLVNTDSYRLLTRPAYYTRMGVSPDNADEAYFLTIFLSSTHDGGHTLDNRPERASPGFDNHDIWIDPTNGDRMAIGNDEGISISVNRGENWHRIRLPIAQLYRVTTDTRVPYYVCGNMQDGPSTCGPSNSKSSGSYVTGGADIPRGLWYSVGGGESGTATPDPTDPDIVWSTASGRGSASGIVVRHNLRTRQSRDVEVWPVAPFGHAAADIRYRFIWDFPIVISPHDHNKIYVGSQFLHVTTNGGQSWQVKSPDLTLNTKNTQVHSGGLTPDNLGVEYGNTIYSIAESPIQPGLIWVGTNDGVVQITQDDGANWTNVTGNIPGMITWGTVFNVEPSRYNAGKAYITVNGHLEGNFDPWVYKTNDYGQTWTLITNGLPSNPLSNTRNIREDPIRPGLLYLATENGMFLSFDDGANWQSFQLNLPHTPVSWLAIQEHFNDLVLSTYGRGFWVLDDLSPFQQLTTEVIESDAFLFSPQPAYRFRLVDNTVREMADDPTTGENPPYGASLSYWLSEQPTGDVTLEISDSNGTVIASVEGTNAVGINRVTWNLRFSGAGEYGQGGGGPPGVGFRPLAPPGKYQVTLRVNGQEHSQLLTLLKDPDSSGSEATIAEQFEMLTALNRDIETSKAMTESIDTVKSQLENLIVQLGIGTINDELREGASALNLAFTGLADSLVQQKPGGFFAWPVKLTSKLVYLANHVQSSDREPTSQALEAHAFLIELLSVAQTDFRRLVDHDLARFNRRLTDAGLAEIVLGPALIP